MLLLVLLSVAFSAEGTGTVYSSTDGSCTGTSESATASGSSTGVCDDSGLPYNFGECYESFGSYDSICDCSGDGLGTAIVVLIVAAIIIGVCCIPLAICFCCGFACFKGAQAANKNQGGEVNPV